jgi:hypothetical protein
VKFLKFFKLTQIQALSLTVLVDSLCASCIAVTRQCRTTTSLGFSSSIVNELPQRGHPPEPATSAGTLTAGDLSALSVRATSRVEAEEYHGTSTLSKLFFMFFFIIFIKYQLHPFNTEFPRHTLFRLLHCTMHLFSHLGMPGAGCHDSQQNPTRKMKAAWYCMGM